jgi:hypothetical protein
VYKATVCVAIVTWDRNHVSWVRDTEPGYMLCVVRHVWDFFCVVLIVPLFVYISFSMAMPPASFVS